MEYQQIVATTERQFTDEERGIEARQADDTAQALLDRRRRSLKRKHVPMFVWSSHHIRMGVRTWHRAQTFRRP